MSSCCDRSYSERMTIILIPACEGKALLLSLSYDVPSNLLDAVGNIVFYFHHTFRWVGFLLVEVIQFYSHLWIMRILVEREYE